MESTTIEPQLGLLPEPDAAPNSDMRTQVWALLTTLYPKHEMLERRRDTRYPFPYLVHLMPVGADGVTPEGETIVVVGKHLSECGLGFYHPKLLPCR